MKAKVLEITRRGITVDGLGTIDSNPDRLVIKLKGVGCSTKTFIEKLISADKESSFCEYKDANDTICDIGGGMQNLTEAGYLVIEAGEIRVIENK